MWWGRKLNSLVQSCWPCSMITVQSHVWWFDKLSFVANFFLTLLFMHDFFLCVCVYPLSIRLDDDEWAEETFIFAHFPVQTIKQSLRHQQGMMHIFPSDSADTKREHHSSQEQRSWEVHSFFEGHISWLVWQSWHFYDHFFFCPLCEKSLQVLEELWELIA